MLRIIVALIFIFALFKWGDWKNWKKYYPTILYFIIGDLAYNTIFCCGLLWEYTGLISHTFSDFFVAFFEFPCIVILFLTYLPKGIYQQGLYILVWTVVSTLLEFILFKMNYYSYSSGWNIIWSGGVFFFAFILISIHYKRPLIVWPISAVFAIITMYIFKMPLTGLR